MAQMVESLLQTTTLAPDAREEGSCLHGMGRRGGGKGNSPSSCYKYLPQKNARIIKIKKEKSIPVSGSC